MPKRVNNIYVKNITFSKLLEAHNKCKKHKRFKKQVIEFEMNLENNLLKIGRELLNETYIFSKYFEFIIYEPKERKIKTLEYRDRVVQTWYVENFLKPNFEKMYINDTFACIEGRGTHKAVDKMQEYLRIADKEYEEVWVLKCDIKKFFFSVDRKILYNLIKRKIKDKHFLRLTKKIIFYDDEKVSIPIGNYTSQIYANIYLNELDRFIKQSLKVKYLVRYMDDFIILTNSKNNAKYFLREIKAFLNDKLKLELNAKTAYFKAKQGVNFCGFRIWKTHRLLREQSKKKMKRKLKIFQKLYKENKIELEYILACINSWRGHAKHCNSYNLEHKMFNEFVLRK
mgnify:CR=1 FL=1